MIGDCIDRYIVPVAKQSQCAIFYAVHSRVVFIAVELDREIATGRSANPMIHN